MTLVPAEAATVAVPATPQELKKKSKKAILPFTERLLRILKIVLKIAKIGGYDENGRVRRKDGNFIDKSNVSTLLNHAMTQGKVLHGEAEFIELLQEAKIDPNLIVNENLRSKLFGIASPITSPPPREASVVSNFSNSDPQKRKSNEEFSESSPPLKRKKPEESPTSSKKPDIPEIPDQENVSSSRNPNYNDNSLEHLGWVVPKNRPLKRHRFSPY